MFLSFLLQKVERKQETIKISSAVWMYLMKQNNFKNNFDKSGMSVWDSTAL